MLEIISTAVDYEEAPVGIGPKPRFSWKLKGETDSLYQSSFHIQFSLDSSFSNIILDKTIESEESAHVQIPELSLQPLTRYFWRVAVTTTKDETSDFSPVVSFVTGYFGAEAWQALMISPESDNDAGNSKGTYLRREFNIEEKTVKSAYLCATAYGLYQAYIDGVKVGDDQLTPGWTSYNKHLCYQTYDVTDLLQKSGTHCIGAMLGAGYYKGKMGFLGLRNNYGKRTGFLAQLHINYADGSSEVCYTDMQWKATDSPVTFAEIYDGEEYDARLEIDGWCQAGLDDSNWHGVQMLLYDQRTLASQFASKVAEQESFSPKAIFTTPQGDRVIDFGQNLAGWIHICLRDTKPGEVVELDCFESLDAEGNVYTENLRGAKNRFVYTCKGGTEEHYHPHFTYQGFRYAKVVSWAGQELTEGDVKAYAVYSKMAYTGSFTCSNPDINQLWSNITWSLRSNFVDIPTDCPQRNERVGWTGDAQIFCPTASYIRGTYNFFDKWLTDVSCDMTPEGGVPHVVPDLITPNIGKVQDWLCSQGSHSASAWADVIVLNPWNLYLAYGDDQILKDRYQDMKKWISFMEAHSKDYMWTYRLQFGDWVALDAEEGSYFGATPTDLTCTAYYALSAGVVAKVAKLLGYDQDAVYYSELEKNVRQAFVDHYFDKDSKGMTVQTQTAHILALYFGLTPEEYKEKTVAELLELLAKENGHLVTGFMGTPYFTHALSQNGHIKEAYDLLLKDDFPSWLYQVKTGATTIWEHWDGLKPDGTMWSADMNSFNHYAYGAIGEWLVRVMAGINIDESKPGYKHVILTPQPGGGLTSAKGVYESVYGTIVCQWQLDGDELEVNVELPANTSATLILENVGQPLKAELKNGHYTFRVEA